MSSLNALFGDSKLLQFVAVFAALLFLAIFLYIVYRLAFSGRLSLGSGRARQPRLGIVDAFDLDRQRQLVIVRRDNVEHLLLIGGPNDVVVEQGIIRGQPVRQTDPQAERGANVAPAPGFDDDDSQHPPLPTRPSPQPVARPAPPAAALAAAPPPLTPPVPPAARPAAPMHPPQEPPAPATGRDPVLQRYGPGYPRSEPPPPVSVAPPAGAAPPAPRTDQPPANFAQQPPRPAQDPLRTAPPPRALAPATASPAAAPPVQTRPLAPTQVQPSQVPPPEAARPASAATQGSAEGRKSASLESLEEEMARLLRRSPAKE